jgi:uncharacterized protein (TIGR02391 family)
MNLSTCLDERLWQAIQNTYESRNFTGAILDSIYFLSDLIRQKTGLSSDGVALIGQALGGKSPKLKVNKLQSESDWNEQTGLEQLLRGLYQCVRNPRSHEKHVDTPEDADAIILFVNLLVHKVDQSKTPFAKDVLLKKVFDPDFVEKDKYAELIVKQIPPKQRYNIFVEVFRMKESANEDKLTYFFRALIKLLSKDDKAEAYSLISQELSETDSTDVMRLTVKLLPREWWPHYEESARLRIENRLIQSVKDGHYVKSTGKCQGGGLGTWAGGLLPYFELKQEIAEALTRKLQSIFSAEQDYVFNYFFSRLPDLMKVPTVRLKTVIIQALKNGDSRFYDAINGLIEPECPDEWMTPFRMAMDSFEAKEKTVEPDDDVVPF